ncbi:Afr1p KNAG_0H02910 [Huiozyma naganishii CBS 8797]|uniref:Uncharacterized protein n=1 Tax=Huiozyma naganishii (strain ATCC MYA-139 / BCRC 22969 / CBS 8797 / KCTC 17520 / NBRC 10181 / NCYC 3082 / Yp74L-3) TaxID=1071383 RepID=J7S9T9_HUIN7|nr:hypothetical protein KNAG_0H02910 [Kazachstania naganishii CBS 8797]CCK71706.1 hypothetical protein KNAG_0H02910 [Kazachstania naganishii CBS 8797]
MSVSNGDKGNLVETRRLSPSNGNVTVNFMQRRKPQKDLHLESGEQFTPKSDQRSVFDTSFKCAAHCENGPFAHNCSKDDSGTSSISTYASNVDRTQDTEATSVSDAAFWLPNAKSDVVPIINNHPKFKSAQVKKNLFTRKTSQRSSKESKASSRDSHNSIKRTRSLFGLDLFFFNKKAKPKAKILPQSKPLPLYDEIVPIKEEFQTLFDVTEEVDRTKNDMLVDLAGTFDNLLLHAYHDEIPKPLPRIVDDEHLPENQVHEEESLTLEDNSSIIDSDILSNFSKLGKMISMNQPPPRSERRPRLLNKVHLKSFYYNRGNSRSDIFQRLYAEHDNVLVDVPVNETDSVPASSQRHSTRKTVEFANTVFLSETWSPEEYNRCDGMFFRNEEAVFTDTRFAQPIKRELNLYKKTEMTVHEGSMENVQYFE